MLFGRCRPRPRPRRPDPAGLPPDHPLPGRRHIGLTQECSDLGGSACHLPRVGAQRLFGSGSFSYATSTGRGYLVNAGQARCIANGRGADGGARPEHPGFSTGFRKPGDWGCVAANRAADEVKDLCGRDIARLALRGPLRADARTSMARPWASRRYRPDFPGASRRAVVASVAKQGCSDQSPSGGGGRDAAIGSAAVCENRRPPL